jgi:hypothetical protein
VSRSVRTAIAAGLLAALVGCSSTPDAAPAPSSSSATEQAPASAAPAEPASSDPTRVIISSTEILLSLDDDSVVDAISYYDPIDSAVQTFTDLLGAESTVTWYEGTAAADYQWPGLRLGTDGPGERPQRAEVYITATVPEINGILFETEGGVQVGSDVRPIAEAGPASASTYEGEDGQVLAVDVAATPIDGGDMDRAFNVGLYANPADGIISQIHAPEKNFE